MGENECACQVGLKLIFACSGAADVGAIADQAARKLASAGMGRMFCLAGIGGQVSGIVETTRAAQQIVVIDGCELDCARKCLTAKGIDHIDHMRVTDLGLQKGKSPANVQNVVMVANRCAKFLRATGGKQP